MKLHEMKTILHQAATGEVPPQGRLEDSDEVIGFSFGLHFDTQGLLAHPGPVNEAMADYIVGDEILRSKNMTLQEELASAVEAREPRLSSQIDTLSTIKAPFMTYNTHELLQQAQEGMRERQARSLAVVAFRYHLPRAAAQVRKAGFETIVPDMSGVGDFDPNSSQPWIRNREAWIRRERKVILAFALANRI